MLSHDFDRVVLNTLKKPLSEHGFAPDRTARSTFSRQVSPHVWHFVVPDPLQSGASFDMKVFATSPVIDPSFEVRFPDDLGIPSDTHCYLSDTMGVGRNQQTWPCKDAASLERSLRDKVVPLLISKGIAYLRPIVTVEALVPLVRHPGALALGLAHIGRRDEARKHAAAFIPRLRMMASASKGDPSVAALVHRFREVFPDVSL